MNVWIVGADGAIGSACVGRLSHHHLYPMGAEFDVTERSSINAFLALHDEGLSWGLDYLVYAAGYNHLDWSEEISPVEMNRVYDVNVTGLVRCLQLAPSLKRVVVIGSDAASRPMRTSIAYNASKAALEAAVKVIARERAADSLFINIVSPGLIEGSPMTDYVFRRTRQLRPDLDLNEYMLGGIPAGRAGRADEIARVVKWLIDDAPNYLNGSVVTVNGAR